MKEQTQQSSKIIYHPFKCNKCNLKFGFESEESDVNRFAKSMNGIKCPKCGDVWGTAKANITHEFVPSGGTRTLASRARENIERTKLAHEQARRYAEEVGREEMVTVKRGSGMGAPTPYGGAVEQIPKRVLDSLEERITSS